MNQKVVERYHAMKAFDLSPVIAFAVRDGYLPNKEKAEEAFEGLLQWLAAHAVSEHEEKPFVMMNGEVDEAYHAFILNSRTYLKFCKEFVGFFIHHTPVDDVLAKQVDLEGGIGYTVNYLSDAFDETLAPALQEWKRAFDEGQLSVTSVSCVRNGREPEVQELLHIADFRNFWDTNPSLPVGNA